MTPVDWLNHWAKKTPNKVFLHQPKNRVIETHTWQQIQKKVENISAFLNKLGLKRGDKIAIFAKNCAEWIIADLAIVRSGMISVPIYPSANAETVKYVLNHSESKAVFIGKLDSPEEAKAGVDNSILSISMGYESLDCQFSWEDIKQDSTSVSCLVPYEPELDDLMTLSYTSGSTGHPKGAMISFRAYAWANNNITKIMEFCPEDRMLSYLPLAHITERCFVEGAAYQANMTLYFTESLEYFVDDLMFAKPTVFLSVPRLWSLFQKKIVDSIGDKKLNFLLSTPFISAVIRKKIQRGLGLEHTRIVATGTAPISPHLLSWYQRVGLNICEGWGMTENCIYAIGNMPFNQAFLGSIGHVLPGCEVKVSKAGELLFKSGGLFDGYYKNEQATKESFTIDGFFKTGDLVKIDEVTGAVSILGRVKDNFKTAKGKFVSPIPIEKKLAEDKHIEMLCIIGSGMAAPIALVVLSEGASNKPRRQVANSLNETLIKVNKQLESHEKVGAIVVVDEAWTPENDTLTPTLKIKRHVLHNKYFNLFGELKGQVVLWESDLNDE
ncbi:AMP-dependent synthetase [Alteromonas portus]|uniref:AMP-dependent synthetase n=2 Tax=Alteromonas portus TaxID=2565549 RepID=A0A4U0Z5B1_9ALTE|nr:AMP-dependent synthetase [Alteromonas portus]